MSVELRGNGGKWSNHFSSPSWEQDFGVLHLDHSAIMTMILILSL